MDFSTSLKATWWMYSINIKINCFSEPCRRGANHQDSSQPNAAAATTELARISAWAWSDLQLCSKISNDWIKSLRILYSLFCLSDSDCSIGLYNQTDAQWTASGSDGQRGLLPGGTGLLLRPEWHKMVPLQVWERQCPCDPDFVPERPTHHAEWWGLSQRYSHSGQRSVIALFLNIASCAIIFSK